MISNQDFQNIDFNEDYIHYCLNQLEFIKGNVETMIKNIGEFGKQIETIKNNYKNCEKYYSSLLDEVKDFIYFLGHIRIINVGEDEKKKMNLNNYKKMYDKYMKCDNSISILIEKDFVSIIRELNQKLKLIITDMHELKFCPPKIGSINDSNIEFKNLSNSNNENLSTNDNISMNRFQKYEDYYAFADKMNNEINFLIKLKVFI